MSLVNNRDPRLDYGRFTERYRGQGFDEKILENMYLDTCFHQEPDAAIELTSERIKMGLSWLNSKLGDPTFDTKYYKSSEVLDWIIDVYKHQILAKKPIDIGPLLKLLSRSRIVHEDILSLTGLVANPTVSPSLQTIYSLYASRSVHSDMNAQLLMTNFYEFIYKFFLEKLAVKCNNGEFYEYDDITGRNQELQDTIFNNADLFEPWRNLIIYCQRNPWFKYDQLLLLRDDVVKDEFEYQVLERQLAWDNNFSQRLFWFWRNVDQDLFDDDDNDELYTYEQYYPGYPTMANLIAIYAVGAAFVKFDPSLLLLISPEFDPIFGKFWNQYGESIGLLQELYDAYLEWSKAKTYSDSTRWGASRVLEASQFCNRLASRMVNESTFDRVRGQLVDLVNKASADSVPLKLLCDYPRIDSQDLALPQPELLKKLDANGLMKNSVWWFDFLRRWWDTVCKKELETRLREIIEETIPSDLKRVDLEADQLLLDSLRKIAVQGPKAGASRIRHSIRHAKLPRDNRRSLLNFINQILNNEAALSQLTYLGESVRLGTMSEGIAEMELHDYIDRWKNVL